MKATALVTGATGFIGSHLARRLLAEGYHLTVLIRPGATLEPALREQCHIVYGDLNDSRALAFAVRDCEFVFHCAANVNTWDSATNYYRTNVLGVQNLLDALVHNNLILKRFVHISTVDVYGYPQHPADETTEPRKVGFGYGDSKLEGEQRVWQTANAHNLPFTIIRPANVIGPGSQFIREIGNALDRGDMLTINRGQAHAGLIDVDNLIDLLLWAARSDKAINEIYNARDDTELNWYDTLQLLQQMLQTDKKIRNLPFPVAMAIARIAESLYALTGQTQEPPLHRLLVCMFGKTCGHSALKIRQASNITSRIPIEESIQRSAQWFLSDIDRAN
ncbi:NAD-dependent epimerase/dehydratase family protein [Litorivivens sp.]|uniref:NAD-dependent epimerase/dehydratase family protein n=1 Tax=Litorivivens sp. TaxID=2020868 RepID=UPI00356555B5